MAAHIDGYELARARGAARRAVAGMLSAATSGDSSVEEDQKNVMQEGRYLGHLEPGMDVCDVDGHKFGSISHVFRHEMVSIGGGSSSSVGTMPREDMLEVKTGFFGLGKHLYVPFSAIEDVSSGCVFINASKDNVEEQGWDVKPDYLYEMS